MSSNRHGARRGQPVLAWCALAVLMVLLIAGCASPGGGASTHNDVNRCAAVLPLARDVVHGQGMLALVRPVNRAQADTITRQVGATPPPRPRPSRGGPPQPGPKACLVAAEVS